MHLRDLRRRRSDRAEACRRSPRAGGRSARRLHPSMRARRDGADRPPAQSAVRDSGSTNLRTGFGERAKSGRDLIPGQDVPPWQRPWMRCDRDEPKRARSGGAGHRLQPSWVVGRPIAQDVERQAHEMARHRHHGNLAARACPGCGPIACSGRASGPRPRLSRTYAACTSVARRAGEPCLVMRPTCVVLPLCRTVGTSPA